MKGDVNSLPWQNRDVPGKVAESDKGKTPHDDEHAVWQEHAPDEEKAEPENEAGQENTGDNGVIKSEAGEVGEADVVKQALSPSSACSA